MQTHITMPVIQTTVAQATAELQRRGLAPADPVTITINPLPGLFAEARAACRARVIAAGLSDDDIDTLIRQARAEVAAEPE
jgi:hypothetical protein